MKTGGLRGGLYWKAYIMSTNNGGRGPQGTLHICGPLVVTSHLTSLFPCCVTALLSTACGCSQPAFWDQLQPDTC